MNAPAPATGGYGLTTRQRQLWLYLAGRESSPSFEEMRVEMGYATKSAVSRVLGGLEERGYVRRLPHKSRSIELLRKAEPAPEWVRSPVRCCVHLPLHGRIG